MKAELTVVGTFFLGMLLCIIPIPYWLLWLRPDFLLLVLIYWTLASPERYGVFTATVLGLLQDSLMASLLGTHMLIYGLVISITLTGYKRLRMYEPWQQAGLVFVLLLIGQLIGYWLDIVTGTAARGLWFLLPAVTGALIWPSLLALLRTARRKAGMVNKIA